MKLYQLVENFILVNKYREAETYISGQQFKKIPENLVSRERWKVLTL
jgi:hypothetical protein